MNTYGGKDANERSRASANSDLHKTTAQRATAAAEGRAAGGLTSLGQRLNSSPRVAQLAQLGETLGETMDSRQGLPVQRKKMNGLPEDLQSGLESLSGLNLDDVAVHYNSPEPAKVAAHAVTQGKNIHLAPGQQRHLNHEAWHVVQQLQDRVKPTTQIGGVQVNDDPGLEREADHMGARAEQTSASQHAPVAQARSAGSLQAGQVSQRRTINDELQALEDEYQQTDDPLLRSVLDEVRLLSDVEFTALPDAEEGHAKRETKGDTRAHLINLDPQITDPETRQSLILHELIHVSADRKYNVNQTGEPEPALTAVVNPQATEDERVEDISEQNVYRQRLATQLASVVEGDWVIDEEAAKLVLARVPRIEGASHREFDSVVTELYYRLKKMGVDERTDTFREVKAMTEAAYRSRNEGLRLDQTYREPMKTGFFA